MVQVTRAIGLFISEVFQLTNYCQIPDLGSPFRDPWNPLKHPNIPLSDSVRKT